MLFVWVTDVASKAEKICLCGCQMLFVWVKNVVCVGTDFVCVDDRSCLCG